MNRGCIIRDRPGVDAFAHLIELSYNTRSSRKRGHPQVKQLLRVVSLLRLLCKCCSYSTLCLDSAHYSHSTTYKQVPMLTLNAALNIGTCAPLRPP